MSYKPNLKDTLILDKKIAKENATQLSNDPETFAEMTQHAVVDIAKAREKLGFSPTVSLEEGMKRSEDWLRESGHLP